MSRDAAIRDIERYFDDGRFLADLGRRVAIPTESQNPERGGELRDYLEEEMSREPRAHGVRVRGPAQPVAEARPVPRSRKRIEDPALPTVLTYGHGDVIRGQEAQWREGLCAVEGDGRGRPHLRPRHRRQQGAAHDQPRRARARCCAARGKLGFNLKVLIETGEEVGSPGLKAFCAQQSEKLRADVLIASDGPRLQPRPADAVPRLARRDELRPGRGLPRRRPSLRATGAA